MNYKGKVMNETQKELFIKLTEFLGQVLGKQYEIVFHIVSKEGSYIAAIVNNHISGRTLNSPLTDFGSKLIQEKAYLRQDFLCNYKALTKDNELVNGSTFFIKKKRKLVGILCINHDNKEMKKVVHKIIELENLSGFNEVSSFISKSSEDDELSLKTLSHNIEDILAQSIDLNVLKSGLTLKSVQKNDIIKKLYKKGIFNIKGSLNIVSKLLKMSESSIYRYIGKFKKQQ